MSSEPLQRRLSAIMVADIVGYSRLVEANEAETLLSLETVLIEIIRPCLTTHEGRIFKQMGDGFIAEFASVVAAVRCGAALQIGLRSHQAAVPETKRLVFRIGINLGDVVVQNEDLFGDGINIAARLEQLCEPGSVLISGAAFDQLQGKVEVPIDFAGEQRVKNIARPIRTYRVRLDGKSVPFKLRMRGAKGILFTGVALSFGLAAAVLAWWLTVEPPNPTKPSIAVLPFVAMTDDANAQRLANGVTEDIITDLARYRGFEVIAHQSVANFRQADVRAVGREFDVNYVLQGSVQSQDERIRISAQLANAQSGALAWSERWDRPIGDFFAVQSELAGQVATRLGGFSGTVIAVDQEVAKRKPPNSLTAYDVYLLALEAQGLATEEGIQKAIGLFKQSLQIDPSFSRAWTNLSFSYTQLFNWTGDEKLRQLQREAALKAVAFDPLDGNAHAALADAYAGAGELDQAESEYNKALELNPNSADILTLYSGWASVFGETQRGVEAAERALRLNPNAPTWAYLPYRWAFFIAGKYDQALAMHQLRPKTSYGKADFIEGAATLAALGRQTEAIALAQEGLERYPDISVESYVSGSSPISDERAQMVRVMTKAGFPMCAQDDVLRARTALERLPECVR